MKSKLNLTIKQHWIVECFDADGVLKWVEDYFNLVVTEGRNTYLDYTLKSGSGGVPAWYIGLKGTGAVAAADVMNSHAAWTDIVPYSNATRPAWTPGAVSAGSVDNSASKASFTINAGTTVYGAFMTSSNTKSGITGILLGAADFGAGRAVLSGDTLNVTVTCSLTSS